MSQIRKRFNCVVTGDCGELVRLWLNVLKIAKKKEKKSEERKAKLDIYKKTR